MPRTLTLAVFAALCTLALTCKKEPPVVPPNGGPDTTSHNFTFSFDTLGDGASSVLYDVAIINDTLAYAVGEIYKRDSLGNWDPLPYNLSKWNGAEWSIHKVPYYHQGQPFYSPIRAVFAFNENDIWFGTGNLIHWNGQVYNSVQLPAGVWGPYRINKIWGHDSEIWIVGDGGSIAHRSPTGTWQRIESGTTANINDILGAIEQPGGKRVILLAASNRYSAGEKKLLSFGTTSRVDTLSWSPGSRLNTVWFVSSSKIFVGGSGLYIGIPGVWQQVFDVPSYYITRMRGTINNDVWVVGAYGLCAHFNGATWRTYPEIALANGSYEGLAVTSKLVIAVGYAGNRAVVLRGRR